MNLIARIFAPPYIKEVIASLDALETVFEESLPMSAEYWLGMKDRVKTWFLEHPKAVKQAAREPNYNPRSVCLQVIATLAHDDLACGRYNVGPGMLSMAGEDIKALYNVAMVELVKAGLGTPETLRERAKELDQAIKEWG